MTQQHDIIAAQREQISDLLRIIGAHTPIAAFDLATTWRAEKALYQEEIAALKDAAKTLQRVQFILGGHSGSVEECDENALRLNVERALTLMREKLPPIVDGLRAALDAREGVQ